MAVFTNNYQPDLSPYVSSYLNDPAYLASLKKLERKQKTAQIGFDVAEGVTAVGGAIGTAAASFFGSPIAGAAVAAGTTAAETGLAAGEKGRLGKINTQIGDLKSQYMKKDDAGDPQLQRTQNTAGDSTLNGLGAFLKSSTTSALPLIKQGALNAFTPSLTARTGVGGSGVDLPSRTDAEIPQKLDLNAFGTAQQEVGSNSNPGTIQTTPTTGNFDWGAFGGTVGGGADSTPVAPLTENFSKGGSAFVHGGEGRDDIALVDTTTGQDTGKRVEKGEMIVFSKDNVNALHDAIGKGDKNAAFKIVSEQLKHAPGKHFKDGGTGTADSVYAKDKLEEGDQVDYIADLSKGEKKKATYKNGKFYDESGKVLPDYYQKSIPIEFKRDASAYQVAHPELAMNILKKQYEEGAGSHEYGDIQGKYPQFNPQTAKPPIPDEPIQPIDLDQKDPTDFSGVDHKSTLPAAPQRTPFDAPSMNNWAPTDEQPTKLADPYSTGQTPFNTSTSPSIGDYAKYYGGQAIGTGLDLVRGAIGFKAANTPLPTYQKRQGWSQYLNELHAQSESGLTGAENTAAERNADQTYAYDVNNIYNVSNGNAGMVLGNLGRAAQSHYANNVNLAALNDEARARNLGVYGGALTEDVNLNRMIFGDKYNEAMATKQAGAGLTNSAITNIEQRGLTDQFYGPGSKNAQLEKYLTEQYGENSDILKQYKANLAKPGAFSTPAVGSATTI